MALPVGTRVVINKVDHLGGVKPPKRFIGRTAVVMDHEAGLNIVCGLTTSEAVLGYLVFADSDVTAAGRTTPPRIPRAYRVRQYFASTPGSTR